MRHNQNIKKELIEKTVPIVTAMTLGYYVLKPLFRKSKLHYLPSEITPEDRRLLAGSGIDLDSVGVEGQLAGW